ncbi:MAG: peptidoglycan-associated lipoprotein Pal [Alphaproteobacteria bacterium]|nr:peptidoglycan-associated lipoprotein Pal [Alphaproteobacteria bacterium]QQS57011.1 MAG: peptidoglycan-associated lipoprotein Pal [Alphaproteobacteria bacterium]
MKSRYLLVFSAMLALSACSKDKTDGAADAGTGQDMVFQDSGMNAGAPVPGSEEDFMVNAGDRVFFDLDSVDLRPEARSTLENQARWLQQYSNLNVTIEGHADERGTREYNLALGERRANTVKNYLVALGIDGARINTISYGKERPDQVGSDDSSWARNRRGVTDIQ